jgi:predicted RNA-binding Zn-ribbon protein involved in translation (DUF1610 family)
MANCDSCGGHLDLMDDDSYSCPSCGETYAPIDEEAEYDEEQ